MKTTIEIPDPLYKKVKIKSFENGSTLKEFLLKALEHELDRGIISKSKTDDPFWSRRFILPEYKALIESGTLSNGSDSTELISEEREER